MINNHYPPAVANPTSVLLVYKSSVWKDLTPVQQAENDLGKKPVFASVTGLFNANGTSISVQQLNSLYQELGPPGKLPATEPAGTPVSQQQYDAYRATSQFVSPNGKTVQFYTSLSAGSPSSTAALNATPDMRSATDSVQHAVGAVDNGVSGLAPASYDVSSVSQSDLVEIVPVVIVVIALLLGLLLRSLIAPVYLVLTVLLSYFAALGIAVLLFQVAVGDPGLNFVLPFLLFVFLMALGEDYNILVMTRIREEAYQLPLRKAVAMAAHHTGTTVTSAGLILAATFGVARPDRRHHPDQGARRGDCARRAAGHVPGPDADGPGDRGAVRPLQLVAVQAVPPRAGRRLRRAARQAKRRALPRRQAFSAAKPSTAPDGAASPVRASEHKPTARPQ